MRNTRTAALTIAMLTTLSAGSFAAPLAGRMTTSNMLKPSTARVGHVRVGSKVDVRYRTEANQRVATRVTVEQRAL